MKHVSPDQLVQVASALSGYNQAAMTRSERLERWAQLLEANPIGYFSTLPGTEHRPPDTRDQMRAVGSAMSIAFADSSLRREGLANDSYAEAKRFFGLSDDQLHEIVCHCHTGITMSAEDAARRIRAAIGPRASEERLAKFIFVTVSVTVYGGLLYCTSLYIMKVAG
jgi:hypothetical protein